ncbi:hypothetical protein, partial [Robinsoniella sp.]
MKKRMKRIIAAAMAGIYMMSTIPSVMPIHALAAEAELMDQIVTEQDTAEQMVTETTVTEPDTESETSTGDYPNADIGLETTSKILNGWINVENDSGEITYEGTWNKYSEQGHSQGNAHQSDAVGATASFHFTGTGIQWIGQTDTNFTQAKVYLDGELVAMPDSNMSAQYQ